MMISTSILNAKDRIDSVLKLNRTNTSYIHIDVMDGKFVDDIQFKINEINAVNMVTKYPMDVHLMVNDPIKYILELKDMNIEYITFHLEIRRSKEKIISKIKEAGYKVGISIKPDTDISKLEPYLKDIDMILVMSVEPGRGGQEFIENTVDRVNKIKKMIDDNDYDIKIEVDGGINDKTISKLENIDIAVVGSYIINSDNYYMSINRLLKSKLNFKNNSFLLYKILLGIGISPFGLLILFGIYNFFKGITFFDGYFLEGFEAFLITIYFFSLAFWPVFLLALGLIIVSIIKLRKIKKLSNLK